MDQTNTTDRRHLESALVIGGTGFVGRHTVRELLYHDYDVTTLARGTGGYRLPARFPVDQRLIASVLTTPRIDSNDEDS